MNLELLGDRQSQSGYLTYYFLYVVAQVLRRHYITCSTTINLITSLYTE